MKDLETQNRRVRLNLKAGKGLCHKLISSEIGLTAIITTAVLVSAWLFVFAVIALVQLIK